MRKIWIASTIRERIVLSLVFVMGASGIATVALMAFPSLALLGMICMLCFVFSGIIAMGVAFA